MSEGAGSFLARARPLVLARMGTSVLTACIPLVLARTLELPEYGTYKQLFLISATLSYLLSFGMAQSLYFFVPRTGEPRPYFFQTIVFLTVTGGLAALGLLCFDDHLVRYFSNPALASYRWQQAAYVVFLIASGTLEISLTTRGWTRQSAAAYLLSDTVRALAMVCPVLLGFGLKGLMVAVAVFAAMRYAVAWGLTLRSGTGPMFQGRHFTAQVAHAIPFGAALLVAVPQHYAHQYVVSGTVSPELFAIYAAGCFQLPLVDLLYTPTSEVLMVRLGELDRRGRVEESPGAFREATGRLALAFFPLAAFLFAAAPEVVELLFGPRFAAATPLFRVSVVGVVLAALPVDGALRARNQMRYLFLTYLAKAVLTVPLVWVGVKRFGMMGGICSWALAEVFGKSMLMARLPRALGGAFRQCLPWRKLGLASAAAIASAAGVAALRFLARPAYEALPPGIAWRAVPVAVAGLLFCAAYLVALRLAGMRLPAVLESIRGRAHQRS